MINKNQLKEIINDLIEVCEQKQLQKVIGESKITSIILQEACSYQRGLMCGEQRKNCKPNLEMMKSKPTEKQIYALKKLNKYKEGITKQEAFKIIKQSKEVKNE